MSSFARLLLCCALSLLQVGQALAHGVTLKLQHALPADSALHTGFIVPWTKQLEEASHGQFRFQLTPAAAADSTALLEQVRQGKVDIAYAVVGTSGRFAEFEQFVAPAGAKAEEASRALWDYVRANDIAKKEFDGLRLIAVAAADKDVRSVLVMNPAAFKALTDTLKQALNAHSGTDASAWIGKALDAGAAGK